MLVPESVQVVALRRLLLTPFVMSEMPMTALVRVVPKRGQMVDTTANMLPRPTPTACAYLVLLTLLNPPAETMLV